MYPKVFSQSAARQLFDFSLLQTEYAEKFIPITRITAFKEKDNEMYIDISSASKDFNQNLQRYRDKSSLIIFTIPSPFGSKEVNGRTVRHAVSAIVDNENKKIYLQEPCYGEKGKNGQLITFPTELRELLEHHFPGYKIIEHEVNVQKRGENICHLANIMRAKLFCDVNSFTGKRIEGAMITREELINSWPSIMTSLESKVPRATFFYAATSALSADIKLALMQKFNIDTSKFTLEHNAPSPPAAMDSAFWEFNNLIHGLLNNLNDEEKYNLLSRTHEFVNSFYRGELTAYGKELVDKIAGIIIKKFPYLLVPKDKTIESESQEITHQLDPTFSFNNPETGEMLIEIATLIRNMPLPFPTSEPLVQKLKPAA